MNKMLTLSFLFVATVSKADIINCVFTEPFIDSTYSTSQSTLTYTEAAGKTQIIKNVSFQIKAPGVFQLVGKNGKVLQTLEITNNASDGMSDTIFPYEVKDTSQDTMANNGIGGCSSNYLKAKVFANY